MGVDRDNFGGKGMSRTTDDPNDPALREVDQHSGMQVKYLVLSEEERAKGYVRPLRRAYIHQDGCGAVTTMGLALSETYARQPNFYNGTFCIGCKDHLPLTEFRWDEDGSVVGS